GPPPRPHVPSMCGSAAIGPVRPARLRKICLINGPLLRPAGPLLPAGRKHAPVPHRLAGSPRPPPAPPPPPQPPPADPARRPRPPPVRVARAGRAYPRFLLL